MTPDRQVLLHPSKRSWVIWACSECDYYTCDKGRGVHMTTNPADMNGPMIAHRLIAVEVVMKGEA